MKRQVPNDDNLAKSVFLSGIWHDVGKIDPAFQKWLSKKLKKKLNEAVPEDGQHIEGTAKFSFEKHPRHNEISLLFFHLFFNSGEINEESIRRAEHTIFWHHTKPFRKNEIQKLVGIFTLLEDFENNFSDLTHVVHSHSYNAHNIGVTYLGGGLGISAATGPFISTDYNIIEEVRNSDDELEGYFQFETSGVIKYISLLAFRQKIYKKKH